MHPEIVRDQPGNCPICGMALEPKTVSGVEEENAELKDMRRRFWISAVLSAPVLISAMSDSIGDLNAIGSPGARRIFEGILATPVVLWGGWPFFVRAWQSLVNRSLNMFTLIGLGVAVAYAYSVVARHCQLGQTERLGP
jgi:Cu+-exporting ATPase